MKREEILKILHKYNLGSNDMMHLIMPQNIELMADEILSLSPVDKGEKSVYENSLEIVDKLIAETSPDELAAMIKEYTLTPSLTAEEIVNGIAEFGEKIDDILEDYFHKKIDLLEVRKQLLGLYSFALRKVEMPSEEDVDKEFPITSETKAVTLSYQANQMAKREGAKWAIDQIKHLNKLT